MNRRGAVWVGVIAVVVVAVLLGDRLLQPATETGAPINPASDARVADSATSAAPPSALGKPVEQRAVSASGVPIRLIRRPAVGVISPPYGAAYAQLLPAAQAGDTLAQLRLGLLLYECRDVPADVATLEHDIESTYQTRRRGGWDVADPQLEEKTLRRRFQDCRDVPAAQRGAYRDWIKQAADSGLLEAQLELPLHLPQGEYCQYLAECSVAQRARQEALQQEAIDYTTRARDAGSAAALWTIGGWYAQGEVLDTNDVEAYANFRALDEINQAAGQPQRFAQMLTSLRARLRPADLISAEARADALLSNPNCCVLTP
ncbi:MAG: sel1 repeat family protein [Nevskia sp.]|nr:sel1 repeat family protein [Nevskia sp.]